MSEKIIQYVVCDNCKKEVELQVRAKNKKDFKKYIKFVGFTSTNENDFCSESCKCNFKESNT